VFCIDAGGIGPFGSPVANGQDPTKATYVGNGNYQIKTPTADGHLELNCTGTTLSANCSWDPFSLAYVINGDQSHSINPAYPGLTPGDVPVGNDFVHCPGCAQKLVNASGAANAAFVATGVVIVGVPLAGEVGASAIGDTLFHETVFNSATNSIESGLLNTWKGLRYGWAYYQYGIVPTAAGTPAGMYVLRLSSGAPSWPWWIHVPYPF
jgi:hypothetical protein